MPAARLLLGILLAFQAAAGSAASPVRGQAIPRPRSTILFFTASWCEPCRAVSPILEKFARKNEKRVKLVAIDFDRAKGEAARWGVQEIPVVIVISAQGKVLLRFEGADRRSLVSLESGLEDLVRRPRERK